VVSDPGVEKPSKRGLSTFLAEHEECGGGFEVQRREGSAGSIVRVICGKCGKSIEYPAASDEELIMDQPAFRNPSQRKTRRKRGAERPPSRDEKGARRGAARTKEGEPGRRDTAVRSISWSSWLPGLIAGLIGGALVLIVIAIASGGGGGTDHGSAPDGESANSRTPTAPPSSAPTPTAPAPQRQSRPSHEVTRLDQRQLADRVSIGVPRGWSAGVEGGAVTLLAANGRAEVQVYYESGERSVDELSRASKTFLLQRHPGGHVADVGPSDTGGGRQARSVRVTYATGTETATVLVADGYSYLILQRLGKPASAEARRTTDAVAMSFRPV
jgi:hypothetical protein